jgi:hypothetical protein
MRFNIIAKVAENKENTEFENKMKSVTLVD